MNFLSTMTFTDFIQFLAIIGTLLTAVALYRRSKYEVKVLDSDAASKVSSAAAVTSDTATKLMVNMRLRLDDLERKYEVQSLKIDEQEEKIDEQAKRIEILERRSRVLYEGAVMLYDQLVCVKELPSFDPTAFLEKENKRTS